MIIVIYNIVLVLIVNCVIYMYDLKISDIVINENLSDI